MKKIIRTTAISMLTLPMLTVGVVGQSNTVASGHRPNEATVSCLGDPNRECAISAAMQTVIGEELGLERARVLVGVARALIELDDKERAVQTLLLALEEARSVRLTLITQEKIKQIAPLLARAGDVADAIEFAREIQIDSVRDRVYSNITEEAILHGDLSGALNAISKTENEARSFREELRVYSLAPVEMLTAEKVSELEIRIRAEAKPENMYRGIIHLAIMADRQGNTSRRDALYSEAEELFPSIQSLQLRGQAMISRLQAVELAGLDEDQLIASYELAVLHGERVRGGDAQKDFATQIGAIEMKIGFFEQAVARLTAFNTPEEKARYLAELVSPDGVQMLGDYYATTLTELSAIEGVYERDLARLALLEGALGNRSVDLATNIVSALEDDDNQALGLALMAPMLR